MLSFRITIIALLFIYSSTAGAKVIGYGWTSSTLPAKNQEWFYMGFELGFQDHYRYHEQPQDVIRLVSDHSGSLSAAVPITEQLLREDVQVLTGFTTSHDALLATNILQKQNKEILTLYIGPGHSSLAHAGKDIYTTGESMEQTSLTMLDFTLRHFLGQRGLVISNVEAVFSVNNRDILQDLLKQSKYSAIDLDFVSLEKTRILLPDIIAKIAEGRYQYLMMTAFAEECSSVLRQLDQLPRQLPILANSSWTTVELLRRMLAVRKAPTYITSLWVKGGKDSQAFEKRVKQVYGIEANSEISYGYDAGIILAETLNRSHRDFTKAALIKSFKSSLCFSGTSTGTICFGKNGGHAKRRLYDVKFSVSKGFELVD